MVIRRLSAQLVVLFSVLLLALFLAGAGDTSDAKTGKGSYIDVHMHVSNQVVKPGGESGSKRGRRGRRGGGFSMEFRDEEYTTCADNMVALMDRYGLERAVIMPQPRISGQPGFYDYRKLLPAVKKYPERLILGGGGGNLNSMIHATDPAVVTDKVRDAFRKEALKVVGDGAKVFGEFAALHVSLTPHHVFEEAAPDHPLFLLLADIAAEHGLPVDIHMEAVVKDTPIPENLKRISTNNPSVLKANIPALERLLAHNRKATIVWQHIGWDNVGQMTISLLQRMLNDHPNLYLGFKVEERPFQVGTRTPMPNRMIDGKMKLKAEWLAFFKANPDRLLLACDQFVGIPGRTADPPQYMEETMSVIEQLPADVRIKVARENAVRLYHLK